LRDRSKAIPQLAGDTVSVAELYLKQAGLRAGHRLPKVNTRYQNGLVITTFPYAGDVVPYGFAVNLLVSTGSPGCQSSPQVCPLLTISMPDVTGQTIDQATTTLALRDITLGSYVVEPSSATKGTVICTDPRAGEAVSESKQVKAGASSGDPDSPPAGFCETASGSPPRSPANSPPTSSSGPPPTSPSGSPPTSPSGTPSQSPSSTAQPSASP
jgi:beta-lactam-binding protein with PASTA domain